MSFLTLLLSGCTWLRLEVLNAGLGTALTALFVANSHANVSFVELQSKDENEDFLTAGPMPALGKFAGGRAGKGTHGAADVAAVA